MMVTQWNTSRITSPVSGIRKYEDELFKNIVKIIFEKNLDVSIVRILRSGSTILGSVVFSWLLKYKTNSADIVHATSQVVAPAALFTKPKNFIVTVHDLAPIRYPFEIRDISEKIQWMFIPKILKCEYTNIIAISEFTKLELAKLLGIDEDRIVVIHQGVDHSIYRPLDPTICKKFFNLDEDKKYILYVASNLHHKRLDLMTSVLHEILKCRDDVILIKAGYSEKLRGDNIVSLGWIRERDMPKLYCSADVYVHTSEYEGFGLPVLEAMSCGVPVVALNVASIPEIVGKAGYLVDLYCEGVRGFAEAVLRTLDRKEVLKHRVLKRSLIFSWKKTAESTLGVYLDLV